ncbi:MAG: hypothetical protein ABSB19_06395 [Methylomonas sp.]|jgi:uncharacterized membrane protein SirB2
MSNHDFYVHLLGVVLLSALGFLALRIQRKRLKRLVSYCFAIVLGLLLVDAATHLLPNTIAGFIYGSRHRSMPRNLWSEN